MKDQDSRECRSICMLHPHPLYFVHIRFCRVQGRWPRQLYRLITTRHYYGTGGIDDWSLRTAVNLLCAAQML